jgi:hypothetical protein
MGSLLLDSSFISLRYRGTTDLFDGVCAHHKPCNQSNFLFYISLPAIRRGRLQVQFHRMQSHIRSEEKGDSYVHVFSPKGHDNANAAAKGPLQSCLCQTVKCPWTSGDKTSTMFLLDHAHTPFQCPVYHVNRPLSSQSLHFRHLYSILRSHLQKQFRAT